ncbi:MAG: AAA family ATPase, partial [Clostridia bacterium]|nr:AAA family ATPase [Clostridia bacterium]
YEKPIDLSRYAKLEGVFDCIYNPLETMLIRDARALGVKAANGLAMLVEQARAAHNLYQIAKGLPTVGEEATEEVVKNLSSARRNIVLVGMAGSGKSAIGKRVAKRLGREFIDTDNEIEKLAGKSIPQIFEESGEGYFRELESQVVEQVCTRQGLVISTGGGAVLNERNVFFIKANGTCYLVTRDVDKLATKDRPLSPDKESAKRLYEQRKPIYLAVADITVDNDGDIESAVEKIVSDFCNNERKI